MDARKEAQDCPSWSQDPLRFAAREIVRTMERVLEKMKKTWQLLGYAEGDLDEKARAVCNVIVEKLKQMLEEEQQLFRMTVENVERNRALVKELQTELQVVLVDVNMNAPLVIAEQTFHAAAEKLKNDKEKRFNTMRSLCEELTDIGARLGEEEPLPDFAHVPSIGDLHNLETLVAEKRAILENRMSLYSDYMRKIQEAAAALNYSGKNSFEKGLVDGLNPVILTNEELVKVRNFYDVLNAKLQAYIERMEATYQSKLLKLTSEWDKCNVVAEERELFLASIPDKYSEQTFKLMDHQAEILKSYYEERKDVFEKVEEWKEIWLRKVDLENRRYDPSRFINRGGMLLQEEREAKSIQRSLARIWREIEEAVMRWDVSHPDDPILLDGMPVMERLQTTKSQFEMEMDQAKVERKVLRQAQLENELVYGSQGKGRLINSAKKRMMMPNDIVSSRRRGRGATPRPGHDTPTVGTRSQEHQRVLFEREHPLASSTFITLCSPSKGHTNQWTSTPQRPK